MSLAGFLDGDGNETDGSLAIIPIIRIQNSSYKVLGTGFFVSNMGIFVTANHVVMYEGSNYEEPEQGLHIIQFLPDNQYIIRQVSQIVVSKDHDVAIGTLFQQTHNLTKAPLTNMTLGLTDRRPSPGERLATFAYPTSKVINNPVTELHCNTTWHHGDVLDVLPSGLGSYLPGFVYRTSVELLSAASGGPGCDDVGGVGLAFSVNSKGFTVAAGQSPLSHLSSVHHAFDMPIPKVVVPGAPGKTTWTLRELSQLGLVRIEDAGPKHDWSVRDHRVEAFKRWKSRGEPPGDPWNDWFATKR